MQLTNGNDPDRGPLQTKTILAFGATGLNSETGKTEVVPQNDPDSLKVAPNGDLLLTSGADDTIIDVHNPGTAHQSVSFTQVQGVTGGLDDVIKPDATSGTFYLADTADNRVLDASTSAASTPTTITLRSAMRSARSIRRPDSSPLWSPPPTRPASSSAARTAPRSSPTKHGRVRACGWRRSGCGRAGAALRRRRACGERRRDRGRRPYRRDRRAHRAACGSAFWLSTDDKRQRTEDRAAARSRSITPPKSSVVRDELSTALAACRGAFFGIGLFSGVINLLMLTGSFYMLEVYDRVLPSRSLPTLVGLTMLAAGLFAFLGLLDLIRGRVLARIGGVHRPRADRAGLRRAAFACR